MGDSPIYCNLHTYEHAHAKPYDALSYVWGNVKKRADVTCDGRTTSVTVNLRDALRRMRNSKASRLVWGDALCINQDDDEKKNEQVRIMLRIYKRADRVLIWLGDDEDGTAKDALDLFAKAYKLAQEESGKSRPRRRHLKSELPSWEENSKRGLPPQGDSQWNTLTSLANRPYFERVWIIQECSRVEDIYVMVGFEDLEIAWEILP